MKDIKRLFIDIETGKAPDCELFMPELKEPRITQKGEVDKRDKSIEEQKSDWLNKCALSPLTGQVLMVGWGENNLTIEAYSVGDYLFETEEKLLKAVSVALNGNDLIIGHYIKSFDLPFIINRCRKHGIKPPNVGSMVKGRWYWRENIIDLADLWTFNKYGEYISLNNMAKYFGLEVKDENIGKNFEEVFNTDLQRALEYCKHDIALTKQIYERLK